MAGVTRVISAYQEKHRERGGSAITGRMSRFADPGCRRGPGDSSERQPRADQKEEKVAENRNCKQHGHDWKRELNGK